MNLDDFCVFILTHGRPNNVITVNTLEKCGYTGKVYIVIDNEDKTADEYYKNYGEQVIMFDKSEIAKTFDEGDNFDDRRTITYARNACFEIASDLGITHFIELDDDYTAFDYRLILDDKIKPIPIKSLNSIFFIILNYYSSSIFSSIAFSQGGDFIGGIFNGKEFYRFSKRKSMNSFICSVKRKFSFIGRFNEDVNTYTERGKRGFVFITLPFVSLTQKQSQSNSGGLSELYKKFGTYVKSFMTVMYSPSCVKVKMMQSKHPRIHHQITWKNAVPVIIREDWKK